jgi:hypothetical protein
MDQFQQALIDVLNRLAAAAEDFNRAAPKAAGKKRSSSKSGDAKPGEQSTRGAISQFAGPNGYGFYEAVIDGQKYSTKRSELGRSLADAYESGALIEITFDETKKEGNGGRTFVNRYIQTVEVVGAGSGAPLPTEETPF